MDMGRQAGAFERALLAMDPVTARSILLRAAATHGFGETVEEVVVRALEHIGEAWDRGDIALSQLYMCGRISGDLVLEGLPPATAPSKPGNVAIVTLYDRHELGRQIVMATLAASGHSVQDWGCAPIECIVENALSEKTRILFVSVLMLPTALRVAELRRRLEEAGAKVRIAVGGAPFRLEPGLWREVGADAMGRTAFDAVHILRKWRGELLCAAQ